MTTNAKKASNRTVREEFRKAMRAGLQQKGFSQEQIDSVLENTRVTINEDGLPTISLNVAKMKL